MKKIVLFLLLPIFISCNKENNETQDYREDFIGNYNCEFIEILHYTNVQDNLRWIDTLNYSNDTIITISKGSKSMEINFLGWNWQISENGVVDTAYCDNNEKCIDIEYYSCVFTKDSLVLYGYNESLTTLHEYYINGTKEN